MKQIKKQTKKPLRKQRGVAQFPKQLESVLQELFDMLNRETSMSRIAVFELDDTLLDGNIGNAAIAHLLENEIELGFNWKQYHNLINTGQQSSAYKLASQALAGMELDCIRRFANVVLTMKDDYISFFEDEEVFKVDVPSPNPIMKILVNKLIDNDFSVYVISSSNQYLVEEAGSMFGISKKHCFGIKHKIKTAENITILTNEIILPLPYAYGKVEIYQKYISPSKPLISAGDSLSDLKLMYLTDDKGFSIWRNKLGLNTNQLRNFGKTQVINYYSLLK